MLAARAPIRKTEGMTKIAELAALIGRHIAETGMTGTALARLSLFRADETTVPLPAV